MPELPEVETIRRQCERELVGAEIRSIDVFLEKMVRFPVDRFKKEMAGAKFAAARRRSKVLILDLSNGYSLLVHFKMSGQLLRVRVSDPIEKHTHVVFHLADGTDLRLRDVRQFGYVKPVLRSEVDHAPEVANLGPEPLAPEFTAEQLRAILERRTKRNIKSVLLDQSLVAGIGNIYADEALYEARIHPRRPAASLSSEETSRLLSAARKVLKQGIERRGTSVDLFVGLHGDQGDNQNHLKVYGRQGLSCPDCEGRVERIKVAGRGTYYCPKCQK